MAGRKALTPWRAAEARLLAKRIDELTRSGGGHRHADVAVLVRATRDLEVYERARSIAPPLVHSRALRLPGL